MNNHSKKFYRISANIIRLFLECQLPPTAYQSSKFKKKIKEIFDILQISPCMPKTAQFQHNFFILLTDYQSALNQLIMASMI